MTGRTDPVSPTSIPASPSSPPRVPEGTHFRGLWPGVGALGPRPAAAPPGWAARGAPQEARRPQTARPRWAALRPPPPPRAASGPTNCSILGTCRPRGRRRRRRRHCHGLLTQKRELPCDLTPRVFEGSHPAGSLSDTAGARPPGPYPLLWLLSWPRMRHIRTELRPFWRQAGAGGKGAKG